MIKQEDIKDKVGFECFLIDKGFTLDKATNTYLNTYDSCGRTWTKDGKHITIGLMDRPCRVGIPFAPFTKDKDYSFLPEPKDYEHYLSIL